MNELQELINKKAEFIVDKQLNKIAEFIHKEAGSMLELGNKVSILHSTTTGDNKESLRTAMWDRSSIVFQEMRKIMLPIEIEKQSKLFVQRVEELQNSVNELLDRNNE